MKFVCFITALLLLTACGQKGALYLPETASDAQAMHSQRATPNHIDYLSLRQLNLGQDV